MVVSGSEAAEDSCKDIIDPSKKKRIHAPADIAFTENKDRDINDVAPFTIYSSSIDPVSGYQNELFAGFKKGVDITNLHSDEYGDDREVTLQSPFTERYVGGNAHRHQDLSGSLLGKTQNKLDGLSRVEAFTLLATGEKLFVLPPNARSLNASNIPIINRDLQTAQVLRDPLAKRPVNIRNFATTTSSISLGNYNHLYDVVQYTTEDQRKDFLVDNQEQMTSSNSTAIPGVKEFSKFYRPPRKSVFKARFAAPGGTEVAGDNRGGHSIDRETNQYSVYNSLNYRNLSVRGPLDYLSKLPQTGSKKDSNSLVTDHKINANPRYRRAMNGATYNGEIAVDKDNRFVTHEIPQNDYQYSWITASLREGLDAAEIGGHLHSFSQASLGANTGSLRYEGTYEFLSSSVRERGDYTSTQELSSGVDDGGQLGTSVHLYKNILIAGAPSHTSTKGAALIFERQDGLLTTYGSPVTLAPGDLSTGDSFGKSVAVSGNYAVVGAPNQDSEKGAVYFFEKQGASWTQIQKITAPADTAGDEYGMSVYMDPDSDFVIVGASGEDTNEGSVYIYRNDKTALTQIQKVKASDASSTDKFSGFSNPAGITIRNKLLVAGASLEDTGGTNRGAAYVFNYDGTQWSEVQIWILCRCNT